MNLDLDDDERGALIKTLLDTIERDPLSLGVKRLRAILAKLIAGSTPPSVHPPPKPSARPSAALARKRRTR